MEEPILSYLNKALVKIPDAYWEIAITRKKKDPFNFTKEALRRNFDLIVVYGGDGTVMEVAVALFRNKTPLLILPGGTANVMANEIGIPMDTQTAVKLLNRKKQKLKVIDMALLGERPFILRIDLGILAEVVKKTGPDSKEKFGRLAYTIVGLKQVMDHDIYKFEMDIDGKKISETGVALMVANGGNIGISGYSLLPQIHVNDGYLDIVLLKRATMHSLYTWIKTIITGKKPRGSLKHWKAKKINIRFTPHSEVICDDVPLAVKSIQVKIMPESLTVVVP